MMLYPLPASLAPFSLPGKLVDREVQDLEEVVEVTKLQVLQIGTRYVILFDLDQKTYFLIIIDLHHLDWIVFPLQVLWSGPAEESGGCSAVA